MVEVTAAVEDAGLDAGLLRGRRERFADLRRLVEIVADSIVAASDSAYGPEPATELRAA